MNLEERAIVIALARCAIACDNPTEALQHQMKRLAGVLDEDGAHQIDDMLEWQKNGRPRPTERVIPS